MNPLEKYLAAMNRFNLAVSELTSKFEQANQAREEALQASAELRRELEATDQRVQDITVAFRQQITADFTAKHAVQSDALSPMPSFRRAS